MMRRFSLAWVVGVLDIAFGLMVVTPAWSAPEDAPCPERAEEGWPAEVYALYLEPIPGLTTTRHPAPKRINIPVGAELKFFQPACSQDQVEWEGALEEFRAPDGSSASLSTQRGGSFTIRTSVTRHGESVRENICTVEVLDFEQAEFVRGVMPVTEELPLTEEATNDQTMQYFFEPSVAAVRMVGPGHYRTSVDRPVVFQTLRLPNDRNARMRRMGQKPQPILTEWRINGEAVALGNSFARSFSRPGRYTISAGPPQADAAAKVEVYRTILTSHASGIDIAQEVKPITFEAVTEPPGLENEITWLSSTKYGMASPVLGYGPTFTATFAGTWGPHPEFGLFQWLGVRADNAMFNQDQKQECFVDITDENGVNIPGGSEPIVAKEYKYKANVTDPGGLGVMTYEWTIDASATPPKTVAIYSYKLTHPTRKDTAGVVEDTLLTGNLGTQQIQVYWTKPGTPKLKIKVTLNGGTTCEKEIEVKPKQDPDPNRNIYCKKQGVTRQLPSDVGNMRTAPDDHGEWHHGDRAGPGPLVDPMECIFGNQPPGTACTKDADCGGGKCSTTNTTNCTQDPTIRGGQCPAGRCSTTIATACSQDPAIRGGQCPAGKCTDNTTVCSQDPAIRGGQCPAGKCSTTITTACTQDPTIKGGQCPGTETCSNPAAQTCSNPAAETCSNPAAETCTNPMPGLCERQAAFPGGQAYDSNMGGVDYRGAKFFIWHYNIIKLYHDWRGLFNVPNTVDPLTHHGQRRATNYKYLTDTGGGQPSALYKYVRLGEYPTVMELAVPGSSNAKCSVSTTIECTFDGDCPGGETCAYTAMVSRGVEHLGDDIHDWHNLGHGNVPDSTLPVLGAMSTIDNAFTNVEAPKVMFWNWHTEIENLRGSLAPDQAVTCATIPANGAVGVAAGGTMIMVMFDRPVSADAHGNNMAQLRASAVKIQRTMPLPASAEVPADLVTPAADYKTHTVRFPATAGVIPFVAGATYQVTITGTAVGTPPAGYKVDGFSPFSFTIAP